MGTTTQSLALAQRARPAELARAIARDELRLHLQPKVDLRDGRVVGVEALVRWQHPELGLLAPADFLPLAHASGQMVDVGEWVLDRAIAIAGAWRQTGRGAGIRIWINLATEQLTAGGTLCTRVCDAIAAGTITGSSLGFEVTESSVLEDLPTAIAALSTLRGVGCEIALDDFGTGYSSLWYLRQLPVTTVKVDRSFVAGLGGSLADEAIVASVIDLAHALGLRVVAEGVEEAHQLDSLIMMGAERAQGFYFSRPAPDDELDERLALPWCGAAPPAAALVATDTRADRLPGFGSPRSRLLLTALDTAIDSIVVTAAVNGPCGSSPLVQQIVYVNAAFEAETGYVAADVVGCPLADLLPDAARPDVVAWFAEAGRRLDVGTTELVTRRVDGSRFECALTLSPIIDERGVHTHWLHVRHDLTPRRAVEAAESRRRELNAFVAGLATRVLAVGRDEVLADLDDVLASLAALVRADVVWLDAIDEEAGLLVPQGRWTGDGAGGRNPEVIPLERLGTWIEHLRTASVVTCWRASDERTASPAELHDTFPGNATHAYLHVPLRVGGELLGVLGLCSADADRVWPDDDVHAVRQTADAFANLISRRRADDALRASEARLTAMLASIDDLLVVLDRDGRIRYVNSRVEAVLGYVADELLDEHFLDFVHPDDHGIAVDGFVSTLSGVIPRVIEVRIRHRDGSSTWFDIDTNGGEDPLVGGYMMSLRDITLQRDTRRAIERRAELEKVALALSQWALEVRTDDIIPGLGAHLESLGRALDADSAFAALLEGDRVRNVAGWKVEGSPRLSYAFPSGNDPVPAIVARYRTLEPLIVTDITEHGEDWADEWRRFPVPDRAGLNVPLVSGGQCLGNIGVAMATRPRVWLDDEIALVHRVSATVAGMLARHRAEASLRTSEARLNALLDGSQDIVIVVADGGTIRYANAAVERSLGHLRSEVVGRDVVAFVHPDDRELACARLATLACDEPTPMTTLRLVAADGAAGWWEVTAGVQLDPVAGGVVLTARDVTERTSAAAAEAARVAHLRYAFDLAQSALDLGPHEFLERLEQTCAEIAGMLGADFVYIDQLDLSARRLLNVASSARPNGTGAMRPGESVAFELIPQWVDRLSTAEPIVERDVLACAQGWAREKRVHLSGERSLMAMGMSAAGELFGVVGVSMFDDLRDWSDDEIAFLRIVAETIAHVLERARLDAARRGLEERLEHQALHDPLTGLANRVLLRSNLADAAMHTPQLAVLLLDLDGFKTINDTHGHALGDDVLQTIADRLRELTRGTDTIARTGGDEFVFLCPGIDAEGAIALGERIVRTVQMPVLAGESTVRLGASVGVAHHLGPGADSDRLLLDADRAMYAAKRAGRGRVRLAGSP